MTASTTALAGAYTTANVVPDAREGGVLQVHLFDTVTVPTTAIDEQDDVCQFGYLPPGIKVHAFVITTSDLDSDGSPALVYKLRIAGSDVVTSCSQGQAAGTTTYWLASPATTSAISVVDFKVTTAAATAAEGTFQARVLYTSA
jgi:hypothetical protein